MSRFIARVSNSSVNLSYNFGKRMAVCFNRASPTLTASDLTAYSIAFSNVFISDSLGRLCLISLIKVFRSESVLMTDFRMCLTMTRCDL